MKIALFAKSIKKEYFEYCQFIIDNLENQSFKLFIYEPFFEILKDKVNFKKEFILFNNYKDIKDIDFLFSIGGDGTILETINLVRDSGIPVLGINFGRLGFLSSVSKDEISNALEGIKNNQFSLDQRTLLRLDSNAGVFNDFNFALNDITIQKGQAQSMIVIDVFIDGNFLNSYWGDGLIIASPTGSTAYSLSCGGPIISPHSGTFILTPIATHNLTVRPFVIHDDCLIRLKISSRYENYLVSLDSRNETINSSINLEVKKEKFKINLVQMNNKDFFSTIREKLNWGKDIRN